MPLVDSDLGPIPEGWGRAINEVAFGEPREAASLAGRSTGRVRPLQHAPRWTAAHAGARVGGSNSAARARSSAVARSVLNSIRGSPRVDRVAWLITGRSGDRLRSDTHESRLDPAPESQRARWANLIRQRRRSVGSRTGGAGEPTSKITPSVDPACGDPPRATRSTDPLRGRFRATSRRSAATSEAPNLRTTRDLLLPRLISGEVDVSELDIDVSGMRRRDPGRSPRTSWSSSRRSSLFAEMGWETVNARDETSGRRDARSRQPGRGGPRRASCGAALERLNPDASRRRDRAGGRGAREDRSAMDPVRANREVYDLMRDGVGSRCARGRSGVAGGRSGHRLGRPERQRLPWSSQLWVVGDMYKRRRRSGRVRQRLPLVFVELKASHKKLEHAYDDNLTDYRITIPGSSGPNGFIILSNGSESKIGTVSSAWEHFAEWKKINDEGEHGRRLAGDDAARHVRAGAAARPGRELHRVSERPGGLVKLLAKNHQYLGSTTRSRVSAQIRPRRSGARPARGCSGTRRAPARRSRCCSSRRRCCASCAGNWTFVIVTDRKDLDDQVYEEFADAGVLDGGHVQATSADHLRELLGEDHRYVFTLIHKFRTERGETDPVVSERSDIVVITDEAHRSQYDMLALNMRNALPNAAVPRLHRHAADRRARRRPGRCSATTSVGLRLRRVDPDGATVPLYYENRIPELQLANEAFDEDLDRDPGRGRARRRARRPSSPACSAAVPADHPRGSAASASRGPRRALPRPWVRRQGDGGLDRQGHRGSDVRQGPALLGRLSSIEPAAPRTRALPEQSERERSRRRSAYMARPTWRSSSRRPRTRSGDAAQKGLDILPHRKRMVDEDLEEQVQGPGRPAADRVRLRDVDHRLRRAVVLDDLPGQADEEPHADADHRPGQPGLPGEEQRPDRRLHRRLPGPPEGPGDLRHGAGGGIEPDDYARSATRMR